MSLPDIIFYIDSNNILEPDPKPNILQEEYTCTDSNCVISRLTVCFCLCVGVQYLESDYIV